MIHDIGVFELARAAELLPEPALAVWATLWPTLVFQSRAFSNTYEVFFLTACAILSCGACNTQSLGPKTRSFTFGVCLGLGTFVRVTMPAYAAPFGLLLLADTTFDLRSRQRLDVAMANVYILRVGRRMITSGALAVAGFAAASTAVVPLDTRYFGVAGWPVVTPWNLLWFNASPANVARFGLHHWWQHVGVNLHFLVGPAVLMVVSEMTLGKTRLVTQRWSWYSGGDGGKIRHCEASARAVLLRSALLCSACVGTAALSLAAHQEPRFLLPATLGIALMSSSAVWNLGDVGWRCFVAYHLCVATFFSCVHQAGVIPMLVHKATERDVFHHVLVYVASTHYL